MAGDVITIAATVLNVAVCVFGTGLILTSDLINIATVCGCLVVAVCRCGMTGRPVLHARLGRYGCVHGPSAVPSRSPLDAIPFHCCVSVEEGVRALSVDSL